MNVPKDKKNIIVIVLLSIVGLLIVYYISIRPMLSSGDKQTSPTENVVQELPTAKPIDIMGKSIENKITTNQTEESDTIKAVFQESRQRVADTDIPSEYDVPLTDDASDAERMKRILDLQQRYQENNENFAIQVFQEQSEQEKAALQKELTTYKELYEQSVADNNEIANRAKAAEEQRQRQWLRVTNKRGEIVTTLSQDEVSKSAFHGSSSKDKSEISPLRNALRATIQETITVREGDILPLRLSEDVYAGNTVLKAGTTINGIVHLSGNRLNVLVSNIEYRGRIMEVNLAVYDVDAQKGIYVPQGDIAQSAGDAITALGDGIVQASTSTNQGFTINQSTQDAVAGVAIRGAVAGIGSILKGKQRVPTVTIRSGYKLYLLNDMNE